MTTCHLRYLDRHLCTVGVLRPGKRYAAEVMRLSLLRRLLSSASVLSHGSCYCDSHCGNESIQYWEVLPAGSEKMAFPLKLALPLHAFVASQLPALIPFAI